MSATPSDHNLLFGILELQVNFLTRDALAQIADADAQASVGHRAA